MSLRKVDSMKRERIEPRSGAAFDLKKGDAVTVFDPNGSQVSDLVAFAADDTGEVISNGRTFDYEETILLTTGSRLWSNRSRVMLDIEKDTVGRHDFLLTPCAKATFSHFYPDKPATSRLLRQSCGRAETLWHWRRSDPHGFQHFHERTGFSGWFAQGASSDQQTRRFHSLSRAYRPCNRTYRLFGLRLQWRHFQTD